MGNNNPVVFVTQETNHNFTKAERYGEVVFLTSKEFSRSSNSKRNDEIIEEMRHGLRNFRPGVDFLLPSGSPIAIGVAFALICLGCLDHPKKIQVLQWDNREYNYYPIELNNI